MVAATKKARKICKILAIVWTSLIFVSLFPLSFWLLLLSQDLFTVQYYSDSANYVSFDGSIESFYINENKIIITFNHSQKEFYDGFIIGGKNYDLATENGLLDILQEGDCFTITSASAYFGDGWLYPVVALNYEGKEIIPFKDGKQNNIELQQQAERFSKLFIIVLGSIVGALAIFDVCSIIGYSRGKKDNK